MLADDIRQLVDHCDTETRGGLGDRALVLLGIAAARRRRPRDLGRRPAGFRAALQDRSGGEGVHRRRTARTTPNYCPVEALEQWLAAADITDGPVFRQMSLGDRVRQNALSAQSVALIIKDYARRASLNPAAPPATA